MNLYKKATIGLLLILFVGQNFLLAQQYSNYNKYKTTVFEAGQDGIDSYRIPSIITTSKGTLLAFCEARKISSTDKTPTDIAVKRSVDNGRTWSEINLLTNGDDEAYMDPVALVDNITGTVFIFANCWPADDHSMKNNVSWVIKSIDDGKTWSEPENITADILAEGHFMGGFGPGSGTQMQGSRFKNRLIVPTRQSDGKNHRNRIVYSDDHGETWNIGNPMDIGGEYDITEVAPDTLFYTLRAGRGLRKKGWSYDGGVSWSTSTADNYIKTTSDYGGCQSSVFTINDVLLFTGPAGGEPDEMHEDRQNLKIYRSLDNGCTWSDNLLLYDKAAGYSSVTSLPNDDIVVVFETADTDGFPKMLPGLRPQGWMRLDVMILSKLILQESWNKERK